MSTKEEYFQLGDILYETFMVDDDFYSIINTCITSTSFVFNVWKYRTEDIRQTCEDYIKYYLSQKHQDMFLVQVKKDIGTEFRILNTQFHCVVLEAKNEFVTVAKFSARSEIPKTTTWHIRNNNFKDSKYFQIKNAEKIYNFDEIENIWVEWVKKNFEDIMEGKIGLANNLLF